METVCVEEERRAELKVTRVVELAITVSYLSALLFPFHLCPFFFFFNWTA